MTKFVKVTAAVDDFSEIELEPDVRLRWRKVDGRWQVQVDAPKAGGSFKVTPHFDDVPYNEIRPLMKRK